MSAILQPSAQLVVPGVIDTPVRPSEGRVSLDASRVPYAQAEVTVPLSDTDLGLIEGLDPRQKLRGTVTASETIAGTTRTFDLAVQSQRTSHDGRSMTVSLGGDETLLQRYSPLVEDRSPLVYQDSVRSVCNYVLRQVITLRRNLVTNPAARTDLAGWAPAGGGGAAATLARVSGPAAGAPVNAYMHMTVTTAGTWFRAVTPTPVGSVTPGRPYTLSTYLRGAPTASNFRLIMAWKTADGVTISPDSTSASLPVTSTMTRVSFTATAPDGASYAVLSLGRQSGAVGNFIDFTAVQFEEAAAATEYFDGDTLNGAGYATEWEGPTNSSPSRVFPRLMPTPGVDANATAYWTVTNLLTEPSHEGALGWVAGANATEFGGATPARTGNYAARWLSINPGPTWMDTAGPIRVSPGRKYTVSTYMRSTSSIAGWFMVRFKNDAGVTLQQTYSPQKVLTTSYQRLVYTVTPPPGATQAMLHIGAVTTAASQAVWNDDVMFYEGEEEVPFFDGNTPNDANYTYTWSGTPQASTSTRTPVIERPLETFFWRPSSSAWDFLMALVGSFGFRLFCDEKRQWFLIDPNAYVVPGQVLLGTTAGNAVTAAVTIDVDDETFCTGVSILWRWKDRWGIDQERTETAGTAGKVRSLEFNRPYPGQGLANAILARAAGRGRVHEVTAVTDLTATPAMKCPVVFPGAPARRAQATAVEWGLSSGLMRVTVRNGNRVPDAPEAPTVTSPVAGRLVVSWTEPDNGGRTILEYRIDVDEGGAGGSIPNATSPTTSNGWSPGAKLVTVTARNIYGWGPSSPATPIIVT